VSPIRLPRLGSVAWAKLEDVNGFAKVRPVAVVTPTAEVAPGKTVRVVAITTRLPTPLPDDHVLLPWDPQGKARSGLRRRCAAVASWQTGISVDSVQQLVGLLPPLVIAELLAKVAATIASPSPNADCGPPDQSVRPS
jgi:mRNA-degrading endonuclease toxin of MazEF toxin-antitoxin module